MRLIAPRWALNRLVMKPWRWWPGISSWCTVAKLKCGVLPRMLISLSWWRMVSVGYDTRVTSPPVKNGFCNCRSGVCMARRQTSLASGGIVIAFIFSTNASE